ncbi:MAG: cob(I)yrinic acid a,c-diamide adenosyltransferase [Nitrososphaera sp.]|uniref:cob(I)yrinic acid a,c-diamide adenosyltransferase n=1 Tax=Nitrososphaera sp. TaxID=1971748 RepID=UPI00182C9437|nr:cob(I)yrinic acid a,c-diamide adenosyltransferase [Nitrososphaera sp.]NWG37764.1 cob(I)yrinic acid a,c-diamide adenosyltransferase [Nitrososphaera sp.]
MKIYTRTGDKGETGLIGGRRVGKDHPRIVAYGAVDELNSSIGMAVCMLRLEEVLADLADIFTQVQNDLFVVGSDLADPDYPASKFGTPRTTEKMAAALEPIIDRLESELPPITFFILPGGSTPGAMLHVCRGVSRRAETAAVALSKVERINPAILVYLNRLADLLFVAARLANKRLGVADVAWKKPDKE